MLQTEYLEDYQLKLIEKRCIKLYRKTKALIFLRLVAHCRISKKRRLEFRRWLDIQHNSLPME